MKTQSSGVSNVRFAIAAMALCSFCFISKTALPGFEIGNGRKLIKNLPGSYQLAVPDKLEVGFSNRFTEVIAPLFEGTPRARLQINIVKAETLNSLGDLLQSRAGQGWDTVKLAGFDGIRKEEILPTRLHQIEYRLFYRPQELIVLNIEGVPSSAPASAFETIQQSLDTFQVSGK